LKGYILLDKFDFHENGISIKFNNKGFKVYYPDSFGNKNILFKVYKKKIDCIESHPFDPHYKMALVNILGKDNFDFGKFIFTNEIFVIDISVSTHIPYYVHEYRFSERNFIKILFENYNVRILQDSYEEGSIEEKHIRSLAELLHKELCKDSHLNRDKGDCDWFTTTWEELFEDKGNCSSRKEFFEVAKAILKFASYKESIELINIFSKIKRKKDYEKKCLNSGTKIRTVNGLKNIENLSTKDILYGGNKIEKIINRDIDKEKEKEKNIRAIATLLHENTCKDNAHLNRNGVCDLCCEEWGKFRSKFFVMAEELLGFIDYEDLIKIINIMFKNSSYSKGHMINDKKKEEPKVYYLTPQEAYISRRDIKDLTEDVKRRAEEKCLEDPKWTYWLRLDIKDLSEEMKRKAEEKLCEDPEWAYYLRKNIEGLPEYIKIISELKACEDKYYIKRLLEDVKDIPKERKDRIKYFTSSFMDMDKLKRFINSEIEIIKNDFLGYRE